MINLTKTKRAPEAAKRWEPADEAFERGQQAYLDWCREIAKLYAEGTTTQEEIAGRYGSDQSRVARSIAIANDQRLITLSNADIPKDKRALYELTTLPDKDFEELCKPTTTQAVILEHKRRLSAPPTFALAPEPIKPPARPPCPGVEGEGVGEYTWHNNAWVRFAGMPGKGVAPIVEPFEVQARRILHSYVSNSTTEDLVANLEHVRRRKHPDKGPNGDTNLVVQINNLLEQLK